MIRKGFAIAGIRGGSGKTLIAMGLARALSRKGIATAPFKKGPDYIDSGWLGAAAGMPCHNLDTYLLDEEAVVSSFLFTNPDADITIVEGNRGLFDGLDEEGTHSAAELAKRLGLPLFLVIDCAKSTRTVAALVHGCNTFDPALKISGVILNNVAGERHRRITTASVEKGCGLPVLGAVSRINSPGLRERHLGLQTVYEHPDPDGFIDDCADRIGREIDIDSLMRIVENHHYRELNGSDHFNGYARERSGPTPVIGVVFDEAFNFYYPETIDSFRRFGAEVVRISAMRDAQLPWLDALYIGGGFPENYAETLSGNTSFLKDLRDAIESGMPVYAECGGLIYLSESVKKNNSLYPLAGVFPLRFELSRRPVAHGYVCFRADRDNRYYHLGSVVRGHEFRYCRILNEDAAERLEMVFSMERGTGIVKGRDGAVYKNTMAAFSHTHSMSAGVSWPEMLCAMARQRRTDRG